MSTIRGSVQDHPLGCFYFELKSEYRAVFHFTARATILTFESKKLLRFCIDLLLYDGVEVNKLEKDYHLLLKSKEIFKYFKFAYHHLNIYDRQTMKFYLKTKWSELTYSDLEHMDSTIQKSIKSIDSVNSLFGAGMSIIMALATGFTGAFIGIVAADGDADKFGALVYVSIIILVFMIFVGFSFIECLLRNRKINRLLAIVNVLLDIKKSEQNKLIKASTF